MIAKNRQSNSDGMIDFAQIENENWLKNKWNNYFGSKNKQGSN